jgi:hypothetical protein
MNIYNPKKQTPKKLVKITVRDSTTGTVIVELLPTKANEAKATNFAAMQGVEVIRVYE